MYSLKIEVQNMTTLKCLFIEIHFKKEIMKYQDLQIDGANASPEKSISGFLSAYFLKAVLILAAPPTGSCFSLPSTL